MSSFEMTFQFYSAFFFFVKFLTILDFSMAAIDVETSPVISNSVANYICGQQNAYQETSQIQLPLKARPQDDDSKCGWFLWKKCDASKSESGVCPSFVLQTCDGVEDGKKKGRGIPTSQQQNQKQKQGDGVKCENSTEQGLPDPKIVSSLSKYPSLVTIETGDRCRLKYCTGLILDENWIIVPQSGCFFAYIPEHSDYFEIVAGEGKMYLEEGTEQRRSVADYFPHPAFKFDEENLTNQKYYTGNIGLVRLSSPLEFNENVQPIDLAAIEKMAPSIPTSTLTIVGWLIAQPMKEDDDELLSSLIESPLDFVPMDDCYNKRMEEEGVPRETLVCAGKCPFYGDEKNQPSRSVLFAQQSSASETESNTLLPVALGPMRNTIGQPIYGVFLNVASYIPWIKETLEGQGQGQGQGQTTASPESESRIIRGEDAPPYKYKSMVNIEDYISYSCTSHGCAGTIVSEEWFVTAAHCVEDWEEEKSRIVVGDHDISDNDENEQVVEIVKAIIHEYFDRSTYFNDIAVVKVTPPFVFNDKVGKVTLPDPSSALVETTGTLMAIGWGLDENYIFPHILKQVDLPVVPLEECQKFYEDERLHPNVTQICTGYEKGTCKTDSGGPHYHFDESGEQILVGITSYGGGDTCKINPKQFVDIDFRSGIDTGKQKSEPIYKPGVRTKVASFVDWIRKNAEMDKTK